MDGSKSMAPFAIEKAVHNIMFIKHHMKRQDEFDAVNILIFFSKCNGIRWPLFTYLHHQFTVLINYLCALDTTLRILNT